MGSAATFTPTCFMVTSVRTPPMAAPRPTSRATFSLGAHSQYTSGLRTRFSSVSVEGVPG